MYGIGDRVMYSSHGVCCVMALEERKVDRKRITYLVLTQDGQGGASFLVPSQNAAAMAKLCPVLSGEELISLLESDAVRQPFWEEDGNRRRLQYREILGSGDRVRILQMICALYRHRDERLALGKKFHQSDEGFLRDAEKLICSEIRYVLQMDQPQAKAFLREKLQG